MNEVLVSVVVPTRNRADRLVSCLRTLVDCKCRNFEIVIVDNCSEDSTSSVAEQYIADERVRYIHFDRVGSICDQFKRSLQNARGEWLMIIGDDDGLFSKRFDQLLKFLKYFNGQLGAVAAISWPQAIYRWPDYPGEERNFLRVSDSILEPRIGFFKSTNFFGNFDDGNLKKIYNSPQIYHSMVRTKLATDLLSRHPETLFVLSPDISFALHLAYSKVRFARLGFPISIAGYGPKSTGVAMTGVGSNESRDAFLRENERDLEIMTDAFDDGGRFKYRPIPVNEISGTFAIATKISKDIGRGVPAIESYVASEVGNVAKLSPEKRRESKAFLEALCRHHRIQINLDSFDSCEPSRSLGVPFLSVSKKEGATFFSCLLPMSPEICQNIRDAVLILDTMTWFENSTKNWRVL
jgi:glycosyltransferase involved in cell wall biosynthesis